MCVYGYIWYVCEMHRNATIPIPVSIWDWDGNKNPSNDINLNFGTAPMLAQMRVVEKVIIVLLISKLGLGFSTS